jgi:hypothetical protein
MERERRRTRRCVGIVLLLALTISASVEAQSLQKVLATGDPTPEGGSFGAPGSGGLPGLGAFGTAHLNNSSQVGFIGQVVGGAPIFNLGGATLYQGIFRSGAGGGAVTLGLAGDAIPALANPAGGPTPCFIFDFHLGTTAEGMAFNANGEAAAYATAGGNCPLNSDGIPRAGEGVFRIRPGSRQMELIAVELDPAPGNDGLVFRAFSGAISINSGAQVLFSAGLADANGIGVKTGLFLATGASSVRIVDDGQTTPIGGTYRGFFITRNALNDAGDVVFYDRGGSNDGLFYSASGGPVVKLVSSGDPSPIPGTTFFNFGPHALNNKRQLLFSAAVVDSAGNLTQSNFLRDLTTASMVAVPSLPLGAPLGYASNFSDSSQVVTFSVASQQYELWAIAPTGTASFQRKVVSINDAPPTGGTFTGLFNFSLNNAGLVLFRASIMGNGQSTQALVLSSGIPCATRTKVPLGAAAAGTGAQCFKVYVPDKVGGKLTVSLIPPSAGIIQDFKRPDGSSFTNGSEVGVGKQGWYTFHVAGAGGYTVQNTFIQEGVASTVPWTFWYFPFLESLSVPHMYDVPGPDTKWDARFGLGTSTLDWENANHRSATAEAWEGHCWGMSLASIVLTQPPAAGGFTQDNLEALAGEWFDKHPATALARFPFEKPTLADTDLVDPKVHRFHRVLVYMLRLKKKAFHMNLRQAAATGDAEVWNQGCYKYSAVMDESPDAVGDPETEMPRQIHVTTTFVCNDDAQESGVSPGDPVSTPDFRREQETEYTLMYDAMGEIINNGSIAGHKQNWLTMKLKHTHGQGDVNFGIFVPALMSDVAPAAAKFVSPPSTPGENPFVTSGGLITLGLTKHPGF